MPVPAGSPIARTASRAYGERAEEYAALLGTMATADAADRMRIESWAAGTAGTILDLGCGPGRWSGHLHDLGHDLLGLDPAPEFLAIARRAHPGVRLALGDAGTLEDLDAQIGAILAWYSLMHLPPDALPGTLGALRRVLPEGGTLLIGFFEGPDGEAFEHRVTRAWTWSIPGMRALLEEAGFRVTDAQHRTPSGSRAHADVAAVAR